MFEEGIIKISLVLMFEIIVAVTIILIIIFEYRAKKKGTPPWILTVSWAICFVFLTIGDISIMGTTPYSYLLYDFYFSNALRLFIFAVISKIISYFILIGIYTAIKKLSNRGTSKSLSAKK